ncbi:MAG: hypothetical protein JW820_19915 [Spirochaetales bacterium]|nr:hypothetical protein [Spirochaetales bacterium]
MPSDVCTRMRKPQPGSPLIRIVISLGAEELGCSTAYAASGGFELAARQ